MDFYLIYYFVLKHILIENLSKQENINIALAKYMGAEVTSIYPPSEQYKMSGLQIAFPSADKEYPDNKRYYSIPSLKYHKEYNWIVPILSKVFTITMNNKENIFFIEAIELLFKNNLVDLSEHLYNIINDK